MIAKGHAAEIRRRGLDAFRADLGRLLPVARQRVEEIGDWDDVKLLTVKVGRLERWSRPGRLCIGDAAHAMSPVGGVGINLAIQDAVAAANLLAAPLREGRLTPQDLDRVQRRRRNGANARHASDTTRHSEARDRARAELGGRAPAAVPGAAPGGRPLSPANSRATRGYRHPPRARAGVGGCFAARCRSRNGKAVPWRASLF